MQQKELFRIGEVSKLFHISVGILRHYEKIGLLQPEYIDTSTGYRYYSTQQFECLNTIRYLRALDMPLELIGDFLKNRNIDTIRSILLEQKEMIVQKRNELDIIEHKINNRLLQLEDALHSTMEEISVVKKMPRKIALLKRKVTPKTYLDLEQCIRELEKEQDESVIFLGKVGVGLTQESLEQHCYDPYEMVFVLLDKEDNYHGETLSLPAETCVTLRFHGGHKEAPSYYEKMIDYIKRHHYKIGGFSKEITMIDYGFTKEVSKFVTEIQIPVVDD